MADIVKMQVELSEPQQTALYKESLKMYNLGVAFGWQSIFFKAAALHNVKVNKWHTIDKVNWTGFIEKLGITPQHASRYLSIGKIIKQYVKEVDERGETPFITQAQMKIAFKSFFDKHGTLTFDSIYQLSRDYDEFRKYIEDDDSNIAESYAKSLIDTHRDKSKPKELSAGSYESQASLFGTHEKILAAGYEWDKLSKSKIPYKHPDGTPMSMEEFGEFVDEESGMMIFRETKRVLEKSGDELVKTIERLGVFFSAYNKKHHTPQYKKLVAELHKEVSTKAKDIFAFANAMLDNEELN